MQSFEVPQNLQCFLCNKYFIKSSHPFILYQCGKCSEKTSYCLFCSNITNKLLDNITFKCKFCNSLQRSKFKEEITKQNDNNNDNNDYNFSPIIKTPSKENFYLSSIKNNGNSNPDLIFSNNVNMFNPRDVSLSKSNSCNSIRSLSNNSFEFMNNDQNLINDFNNKIVLNNSKNNFNINSNIMNNGFINNNYGNNSNNNKSLLARYNLLKNKKNLLSNKKNFLSSISHSSSKHYCFNPEINSNNNNFNNYNNNNNNIYNFNNNFGQNSIIGNPNQTPHKFIIPNFDSNSFQISSI